MKKSMSFVWLCILAGVALVACGRSQADRNARATQIAAIVFATQTAEAPTHTPTATPSPTPTGTATPTNTPTATPSPSPTPTHSPTPTAVPPSEWPLVLLDTFEQNVNDWPSGLDDNEFVRNKWRIVGGKYTWKAKAHQPFHWYAWPDARAVSDFHLSVEAQQVSGPEENIHGLVFRVAGDDFYYFGISNRGEFIFLRMYKYRWRRLIDWTRSSAIQPWEVNKITVVAEGSQFSFFINDEFVAEAEDDILARGRAGVTIELFNAGDEAAFEFDNFELRAP